MGDATQLQLQMLGTLRLMAGGREMEKTTSRKAASLLAFLALRPGVKRQRDRLIDLLWPDVPVDAARHNLRQALYSIRRDLDGHEAGLGALIKANPTEVWIERADVATDVAEFETLAATLPGGDSLARMRALERAADLYRGDFLAGNYDPWTEEPRRALERAAAGALRDLVALLEDAEEIARALPHAERLAAMDPLDGASHAALIRLYRAAGHHRQARSAYDAHAAGLFREMRSEPSEEVRLALASSLPAARAPRRTAGPSPSHPIPPLNSTRSEPQRTERVDRKAHAGRVRTAVIAAALVVLCAFGWSAAQRYRARPARAASGAALLPAELEAALAKLRIAPAQPGDGANPRRQDAAGLCRAVARQAWSNWYGPEEQVWVLRLQSVYPSLQDALDWTAERDAAGCAEIAGNLTRFWYLTNQTNEARRWTEIALRVTANLPTHGRAMALIGSSLYLDSRSGALVARPRLAEAISILRACNDSWGVAHALRHLGLTLNAARDYEGSYRAYQEALARFQRLRDARGEALTLFCLCMMGALPDSSKSQDAVSIGWICRSLHLFRVTGNDWGAGMAFRHLQFRFDNITNPKVVRRFDRAWVDDWRRAMLGEYREQIRWEQSRGRPVDSLHLRRLALAGTLREKEAALDELVWIAFVRDWPQSTSSEARRIRLTSACFRLASRAGKPALPMQRIKQVYADLDGVYMHRRAELLEYRREGQKLTLAEAISLAARELPRL